MLTRREALGALTMLGGTLCGLGEAQAALSRALTVRELARQSPAILLAEALEARSAWEEVGGRRRIVTYTRIGVAEGLRAMGSEQELLVQTLGGQVGEIGQKVSGEAALTVGERSLLFLTPTGSGVVRVTGMAQGHYRIEAGADGDLVLRASRHLGKLQWVPDAAVKRFDGQSVERSRELVLEALR